MNSSLKHYDTSIYDALPVTVIIYEVIPGENGDEVDYRIVYGNRNFARDFQQVYGKEEFLGACAVRDHLIDDYTAHRMELSRKGAPQAFSTYVPHANLHVHMQPLADLPEGYLGFIITNIEDFTKEKATVAGIDEENLYSGEVTFTVSSEDDQAVLVAVKKTAEEDDAFELVKPTTDEEGNHSFKIEVTEDTTIALVFRGDANLNGKLETRDATLICQVKNGAYSNRGNLSTFAADVNNNGKVETRDATLLAQARNNNYTISW